MNHLRHELLDAASIEHGFGTRGAVGPPGVLRPRQVHGTAVAVVEPGQGLRLPGAADSGEAPPSADAAVSREAGTPIGVVTADCLPLLIATPSGTVAAVHAGWRGLAAGVIPAALAVLRGLAEDGDRAVAVIGPYVGPCCYEVDAPVHDAFAQRLTGRLRAAFEPTRPGRWNLDLAAAARVDLMAAGVAPNRIGGIADACTACDSERFHSYRRDGPRAGRLLHFVTPR